MTETWTLGTLTLNLFVLLLLQAGVIINLKNNYVIRCCQTYPPTDGFDFYHPVNHTVLLCWSGESKLCQPSNTHKHAYTSGHQNPYSQRFAHHLTVSIIYPFQHTDSAHDHTY